MAAPGTPAAPQRDPLAAARRLEGRGAGIVLAEAARAAGATLEASHLRSIHHRPGRSMSQVHEATLRVGGTTLESLLVAHVDTRTPPDDALVLESEGDLVAVWRFPHDPWLPGLPSALDPGRVRELLDQLGAPPGAVELRTRAYRPTRRAVIEVTIHLDDRSGRILYFKVLAGRRARELAGIHTALAPTLPVPGVVGLSDHQGILALEAVPGRTLVASLVDGEQVPEPGELVELSQRIAASELESRRDPRRFADATRHVGGLIELVPHMDAEIARIARAAGEVEGDLVPVHGDLHGGQVLLVDGTVSGLLDVDGAGTGLQAQDVGGLVAHVEAIGLVYPSAADRARAYSEAIAEAWRPLVGEHNLARATAGAWIGLATGPYRAQEPDWVEATEYRVRRAGQVLVGH